MNIKDFSHEKLYLLALSGGADSVALALMMREEGLKIHALHCNFHLRGEESNRDEDFVRCFCNENNIPLTVQHFNTQESARNHKVSIEMEARHQRYEWFAIQALTMQAEAICVAHHKDDQAETLLLNLIRGTGLKGLSAMPTERTINGLHIIRPLLDMTKQEILQYLKSRNQQYVTDSTNMERDALRNRIRLDLLPLLQELNPNITDCLARTAENVRMALDQNSNESEYYSWLAPYGFNRQQILDIYAHRPQPKHESNMHTGRQWFSPTHVLLMNRGKWILEEKSAICMPQIPDLIISELAADKRPGAEDFQNREQAFIDAGKLEGKPIIRLVQSSDRFRPYGMNKGTKLVSDYLTDRKVDLLSKRQQLVVIDEANNNIIWLVGREIDHRYRVTPSTKRIIRIGISK